MELRHLSIQRTKQLENLLKNRELRIKELTIQANEQELETAKVKEQLMAHAHLVEQYEGRFAQVREIIDSREKEYSRKVADMQIIIEDQNAKIDK